MFNKLTRRNIGHAYNNVKNFLGSAYHHTRGFVSEVDKTVKYGRVIYGALAPVIESALGSQHFNKVNKNVMKGLSDYENVRNTVMEGHERVLNQTSNVISNLKKHNISIGL